MPFSQTSQPNPRHPVWVTPIVLYKTDVMYQRVHAQCKEAAEIQVSENPRRRLHHHLKLVVVLQPVRIFPVAPVCRPTTGLHIGRIPVFRAQCTQKVAG